MFLRSCGIKYYSRAPKSERSEFGTQNSSPVFKQFGFRHLFENQTKKFVFQTEKSVWNRNFIAIKWNKKFQFQTRPKNRTFCFVFRTVWKRNFLFWFQTCLETELFGSVFGQFKQSAIGTFCSYFRQLGPNQTKSSDFRLSEILTISASPNNQNPNHSKTEHVHVPMLALYCI